MAVDATWEFAVDLNNDGDFLDANENIMQYVKRADWQIGFTDWFQTLARSTTCTLFLNNASRKFSPEHASALAGLDRGRKLRIRATYSAVTYPLVMTSIERVDPDPLSFGSRESKLTTEDYFVQAQRVRVAAAAQINKRVDEVLENLIRDSNLYPPIPIGARWRLGIAGLTELGTMQLGAATDYLLMDVGKSVLGILGDKWNTLYDALRDLASREFGRIFVDRQGYLNFWNRHHLIETFTSEVTINNIMHAIDYAYGELLANRVIIRARPRSETGSAAVLASMNDPIEIPSANSKKATFSFMDSTTGSRIGGRNIEQPIAYTDYTANIRADGGGADATNFIQATVTRSGGSSAEVEFVNSYPSAVFITSAQVRGIKITDFGEIAVPVEDASSIATYRAIHERSFQNIVADTVALAEGIGKYILQFTKTPRGRVKSITLTPRRSDALMTAVMTKQIGSRITVKESQTGVDSDYFIIGEKHQWAKAGKDYKVTWFLEPAPTGAYWLLGVINRTELGTAVIAPF